MDITPDLVQHVAKLASLELTAAEMDYAQRALQSILDYAAELAHVPVRESLREGPSEGLAPAERLDQLCPSLPLDEVLYNAPATQGTAFLVPRIIE